MRVKLLAATIAAFAVAGPALAADLPSRAAPPVYVPPPPVFTWTGFYVGLNAGYGWGQSTGALESDFPNIFGAGTAVAGGFIPASLGVRPQGVLGGGQFGYNWQTGPFVLGLETDFQGSGIRNTNTVAFPGSATLVPSNTVAHDQLNWFGTARARAGYLPVNNLLLYATGGLAYGNVQENYSLVGVPPTAGTFAGSASATRVGWTAGAGAEWKVTNNISLKAEYLYVDLGSTTVRGPDLTGIFPGVFYDYHFHNVENIARVGLNYEFNWAPPPPVPVVAKY